MFKLKDKVFYPGHGVANIDSIENKVIAESAVSFFKLQFLFKEMTILVPVKNVESIGVRALSKLSDIDKALNELYQPPEQKLGSVDFTPTGWNKRNKDYQLKIQRGSLAELTKVYRDLMFIAKQKDLSFGERNLLNMTEDLIIQEIVHPSLNALINISAEALASDKAS
mgnify:CR=1 FL=1